MKVMYCDGCGREIHHNYAATGGRLSRHHSLAWPSPKGTAIGVCIYVGINGTTGDDGEVCLECLAAAAHHAIKKQRELDACRSDTPRELTPDA